MDVEFKSVFLVCIDHNDDMNYVVGRSTSLGKAQKIARLAESFWPNRRIYLTEEKTPVNNPLDDIENHKESLIAAKNPNSDVCICGKNPGGCIGSLSCKCKAIARCKKVTQENPLDFENYSYQAKPKLEPTFIHVRGIGRGIVEVVIPAWNPEEVIGLSPNEMSAEIREILAPNLELVADVNLSASTVSQLILENLRYEPVEAVYEEVDEEDEGEIEEGEYEEVVEDDESPPSDVELEEVDEPSLEEDV